MRVTYRTIKVTAWSHVIDLPSNRDINGSSIGSVVGQQRGGSKGPEDDRGGTRRELERRPRPEAQIDGNDEKREKDEVSGRCNGDPIIWLGFGINITICKAQVKLVGRIELTLGRFEAPRFAL